MKLSVIINTKNEGGRVRSTCEQFLRAGADEIVVCADGTTDGSCDNLPKEVLVVRNTESQGCGKAKARATMQATGDVLMWVDAHQSVEQGDIRAMAQDAVAQGHVVSPALVNIAYDAGWNPHKLEGSERVFYPNNASLLPGCTKQYSVAGDPATLAVGVGVCMSRQTYVRLGGWNRYMGRHGAQERGMALRAYMADVPVRIDPSVILGHEFYGETHPSRNKSTGQYRFNNIAPATFNTWHAFMTVCSPGFFSQSIQPWLMACEGLASGAKVVEDPVAQQDRDYFLRHCQRRPDGDLLNLVTSLVAHHSPPRDPGTATLEPMALSYLKSLARGRCLECGTGSTGGTQAILNGAMQVVSIDHLEKFASEARTKLVDERVEFLHCPRNPATGFYDVSRLTGRFDFMLIDGPPGTQARRHGIQELLPLLAPGGVILVDDAKRDAANIEVAVQQFSLDVKMLPTRRGLAIVKKTL